ncbi:MAG TPA: hypothetical protein VF458_02595, partial [Ktedonobacteraceae bacterium]
AGGRPHNSRSNKSRRAPQARAFLDLDYHVYFLKEYKLPVLSLLIYAFPTTVVESPLIEKSGDEVTLTFKFHILCLWKLNAEEYIQEHVYCMYSLLPARGEASAGLLISATDEMAEYYKGEDFVFSGEWIMTWLYGQGRTYGDKGLSIFTICETFAGFYSSQPERPFWVEPHDPVKVHNGGQLRCCIAGLEQASCACEPLRGSRGRKRAGLV